MLNFCTKRNGIGLIWVQRLEYFFFLDLMTFTNESVLECKKKVRCPVGDVNNVWGSPLIACRYSGAKVNVQCQTLGQCVALLLFL